MAGFVLCLFCPESLAPEEAANGLSHWLHAGQGYDGISAFAPDSRRNALSAHLDPETLSRIQFIDTDTGGSLAMQALAHTHRAQPSHHVALARADARLPADGLLRLACALRRAPHAGVVSPLSDEHPLLSPFASRPPDWLSAPTIDRWLTKLNRGLIFDLPVISGRCALFRADAVHAVVESKASGPLTALSVGGWASVACDWVFCQGLDHEADLPLATGAEADITQCETASPLGPLRHAFGEIANRPQEPAPPSTAVIKPVQLHITHSWGGGLGKWIADMCAGDTLRHNLVLRSIGTWGAFGQRIALYAGSEMGHPLREWPLSQPIRSVALAHHQYRNILAEIVRDFEVDVVLVSSVIGHSLDALDSGLPTLVCAHDYFPFCPALVIHHQTVCGTCDTERLTSCFADNPLNRFFSHTDAEQWQAIRQRYLKLMRAPDVTLAAPSHSVIEHLGQLAPELQSVAAHVVENGLELVERPQFVPGERLSIVVLGSLAPHKGADLLFEVIHQIARFADVHLIGCGDGGARFDGIAGVHITAAYRAEALPALISDARPHLGLLLSMVPETFSYTLSELWALGVPVVATRVGAFADRIRHQQTGWLIEPDASSLLDALQTLDQDRPSIDRMREIIAQQPPNTVADMVAAYQRLTPLPAAAGRPGPVPTAVDGAQARHGALIVDRQVPLRLVLIDFLRYLQDKTRDTPRLRPASRSLLGRVLKAAEDFLGRTR